MAVVALVTVGVPVGAEIAASVAGNSGGRVFQIGAVLGAAVAAWLGTRRGLWWIVPAQPLVVVPVAVVGTVLNESSGANRTKLGTDALAALQHAFLVTLAALAAVVLVAVVKAVATGTEAPSRRPAPSGRRGPGTARARRTGARRG